jgi:hypothetical protein
LSAITDYGVARSKDITEGGTLELTTRSTKQRSDVVAAYVKCIKDLTDQLKEARARIGELDSAGAAGCGSDSGGAMIVGPAPAGHQVAVPAGGAADERSLADDVGDGVGGGSIGTAIPPAASIADNTVALTAPESPTCALTAAEGERRKEKEQDDDPSCAGPGQVRVAVAEA